MALPALFFGHGNPLPGLLPALERLYTDVQAHPELSMQESRTAGLAADRLRSAGYEVTTGIGKTGVVGLLRNGEGPTVMLRSDMDALPVDAVAALAGAVVVAIGAALRLPSTAMTIAGAALCFGLRFLAIRRGWHLPIAGEPDSQ